MDYICFASSSSGNCALLRGGGVNLLIDAGISMKRIRLSLRSLGLDLGDLRGVLVTHEHSDHIQSVGVLARKYHLPVFATQETWQAMINKIGKVPGDQIRTIQSGRSFWLGEIGVEPFGIPHDAADPVGYRLWGGNISVSTATDLGEFTDNIYSCISGSTLILLESNHDPDLLRANPRYSPPLKSRILGNRGHLSNEACAKALLQLIGAGTKHVVLGHLSEENNTPTLARNVSEGAMTREGIQPGKDVQLEVALREEVSSIFVLKETE